jgi:hypothetical protein
VQQPDDLLTNPIQVGAKPDEDLRGDARPKPTP